MSSLTYLTRVWAGSKFESMVRSECPGCTCGVESSLAMKYSGSGTLYRLTRLSGTKANPAAESAVEAAKDMQPERLQILPRGKSWQNRSLVGETIMRRRTR